MLQLTCMIKMCERYFKGLILDKIEYEDKFNDVNF